MEAQEQDPEPETEAVADKCSISKLHYDLCFHLDFTLRKWGSRGATGV